MRRLKRYEWLVAAGAAAVVAAGWPLIGGGQRADAAVPHAAAAATGWTGTWAVSPESGGPSYNNQTLRQIVHTSIGGTSARVQISNVFGTHRWSIADVHVAQRSSGSTITGGTDHAATFGGQTTITIPAGGLAVSDAVSFTVPALSDIAISMYLPQATGASTYHAQGNVTNYVAAGDVSGNGTPERRGDHRQLLLPDQPRRTEPRRPGAVVTLGASITDGVASGTDDNRRWPNDLALRLANAGLPSACSTRASAATGCWSTAPAERDQPLRPRRARPAWGTVGDLLRRPDQRPRLHQSAADGRPADRRSHSS